MISWEKVGRRVGHEEENKLDEIRMHLKTAFRKPIEIYRRRGGTALIAAIRANMKHDETFRDLLRSSD